MNINAYNQRITVNGRVYEFAFTRFMKRSNIHEKRLYIKINIGDDREESYCSIH